MTVGWIKIHRSIKTHWLYNEKPYSRLNAWLDILLEVNHTENKFPIKDKIFICKRGESLNSLDTWSKRWGWNKSKVRRFLKLLESDSMIELKSEHKTTRLTVCNYDTYQDERNADETQMKRKRNADETHLTPNKNDKNNKNEKNNNISPEISDEYVRIAKYFYDLQKPKFGNMKFMLNVDINKWADEIRKLVEIDGKSLETIKKVLRFAIDDDFWCNQLKSLTGLRKKSKSNDVMKFENIEISMNKSKIKLTPKKTLDPSKERI